MIKRSPTMSLLELGRRTLSSFNDAPINFAQLHPKFSPRGKARKRISKDPQIKDHSLRVLIRVKDGVERNAVRQAVLNSFGASEKARTKQQRLVDDLRLRQVAAIRHAQASWWLIELPVSLGSFLSETGYDLKQLDSLAKKLTAIDFVDSAEADVPYPNLVVPQQEQLPGCTVGRANAPQDKLWSQRLIRLLDGDNRRLIQEDGRNIIIGMIDTGYTNHTELNVDTTFDLSRATSVIDSSNGYDPMTSGSSHGTATGTVITSAQHLGNPNDEVVGIAPGVTVVAVRALDFVIVLPVGGSDPLVGEMVETFLPSNILDAMQKCIDAGCHVINMSFGGLVSQAVRDIIKEAYERDIIMCAAAGNCVQFVVEPASRPEVIACAAAGLDPGTGAPCPWTGTSRGPQIDISAPGENVYIGDWENGHQIIRPGEGTSYAAPHLSAAAALWLQKHGIDYLKELYNQNNSRFADVFRTVVCESAYVPGGWNTNQFGAGILNLKQLLDYPLPKSADPKGEILDGPPCEVAMSLINTFLSGERLPVLSETVNVRVDVATVEVRDDGEALGGSEPYLIETFYRIDGRRAKAELLIDASTLDEDGIINCTFSILRKDRDTSIVKTRQTGKHGNLPTVDIDAARYSDSGPIEIDVPNDVGRWNTSVRPIPLRVLVNMGSMIVGKDVVGVPGFIGALTMLMEDDQWSDDIVQSVKDGVRTHASSVMEETLSELCFSLSIAELRLDLPSIDTERLALEVEDRTRQSVYANASWLDAIFAAVDGDEMLIQDFTMVNVLQLGDSVPIAPPEENGDHGRWLLRGSISKR